MTGTSMPTCRCRAHSGAVGKEQPGGKSHSGLSTLASGFRADNGLLILSGNGEVPGENFGGEQPLRSGCFIAAGAVIVQTGKSNRALCL